MIKAKYYAAAIFGVGVGLAGLALGAGGGWQRLGLGPLGQQAGGAAYAVEVTQTPDPLWAASTALDDVLDQYPGSTPVGDVAVDWHRVGQHLERQAEYQTRDPLAAVQSWYGGRLHVSPASDVYVTGGDGCATLSHLQRVLAAKYTVTVLLCTIQPGTRVAVTEILALEE